MPSPTSISETELNGLLKNVYAQFRMKVQNMVTPLLAQLQKAKAGGSRNLRWGGRDVFFDVVVGRPSGAVFSNSGFFPSDTYAQETQAQVGVTRAYVTRQIDGLAFVGTTSKEAAYTTIAKKTMEEIKDASAMLMQQALHNKPDGVVGIVTTTNLTTTTFDIIAPYGLVSPDTAASNAPQGSLLLSVGDTFAILQGASGTTVRGRAVVSSIGSVASATGAQTVTFSPAITTPTANDRIVKISNNTSDAYTTTGAMNGLINITNRRDQYRTGAGVALHGVDANSFRIWDSVRMTAGIDTPDASAPTESDIWDLIQRINGFSGKDAMANPGDFLLITTPGIAKKLMESMVGQRRFTANEFATTIKGGYKAIEVCGIPCIMDYYVPLGTIYLLHLPSLAWVDAKDWGFVEYESSGAWRFMAGRDAFETSYSWYGNLACLQRNAHGSIVGYVDTTKYTHII